MFCLKDADYDCVAIMPSVVIKKIITDMREIGETVTISCTKGDVQFLVKGDIGNGTTGP